MSGSEIPHFGLARQYEYLKEELLDATDLALRDGNLVGGKFTKEFEHWLRLKTKTKYAVTVHSGTQALEIIARYKHGEQFKTQGTQPTIKIPNFTYPATLNAFVNAGWDIELVDTDKYGIIQPVSYSTICLVGLYGRKPWDEYPTMSKQSTIIDGAQHWLVADGQVGLGMAISFDPTKNLNASGNGGAIVTNDEHLYLFATNYRDNSKPYFANAGTNSKMSEQDCAQILVRARYIDAWQKRREEIAKYWCESFKDLPVMCLSDSDVPHAHQKFVLYLADRNSLHTHCMLNKVSTKIHYEYVLGDLPSTFGIEKPDMLSKSVMLSRGVISLPIYPELRDYEVEYIKDTVISYFQ